MYIHTFETSCIGENESVAFWTTIFNELKNRGVKDILIACHDNLSGFANALSMVFPKAENQLCIIHMIRNSTKFRFLKLFCVYFFWGHKERFLKIPVKLVL